MKHDQDFSQVGGRFVLFVLSLMEVWHGDFQRELRNLYNCVAIRRGKRVNESWKFLQAELSCALAKGNCRVLPYARNKFQESACQDTDAADEGGVWPDRLFLQCQFYGLSGQVTLLTYEMKIRFYVFLYNVLIKTSVSFTTFILYC